MTSLRSRTGTLVAASAVVATLLAKEVFTAGHPEGWIEWTVTGAGLAGSIAVLFASVFLLRSHDLTFSVDADVVQLEAAQAGMLEPERLEALQLGLASGLSSMQGTNAITVDKMKTTFAVALTGLLAQTLGLGLGAALV